jgi:hypothetical protein
MSHAFDPHQGLVIVNTEVVGHSGTAILRLALDTGATTTLINVGCCFQSDTTLRLPWAACE